MMMDLNWPTGKPKPLKNLQNEGKTIDQILHLKGFYTLKLKIKI